MRSKQRRGLSDQELEAQAVAELPERQVLSLLNPSAAAGALGWANSLPPLVTANQSTTGPTTTTTGTNVNSPGIVTNSDHFQNAPIMVIQ